ncbi:MULTISPECIES: DUF3662 domain-containing protein [Streptomycetaceae]|uniref:FhaA N-terminal domain-containing protein n=1 Tax=Streptantibioticus cattleyicolor (strain ATCC 35852 / DSM 46488 / JCM 4925 / NBRC 14057 / NRRL 8057) TaxID=1003195 RepID=F8JTY9_STREN|nr:MULTISPECIES: DUF3662 domain-containing protein [Streptomycetaceae]AEW98086.1 hypothetical protein SCATT_57150 [Streptantibioticus cattleyicolor NRRL 8057 = DSM 46488]MYS62480.1 DUF3662 domain-containing protein [Streptomyces sp. SID5468]CCB78402.1 conserved protein of unknown function [Streptantibioticus cattleyicolor NRRL 8057 = DSM 46488]
MGPFSRCEEAIERVERALVRKVLGREQVELLDVLRRECDGKAVVCGRGRVVVPNVYTVEIADDRYAALVRHGDRIGEELTDSLARHGEHKGYEWAGPLTVHIDHAARVPNGRYRVSSSPMTHIRADALTPAG